MHHIWRNWQSADEEGSSRNRSFANASRPLDGSREGAATKESVGSLTTASSESLSPG